MRKDLVVFIAPSGSGKTTLAKRIVSTRPNSILMSFADPLRGVVSILEYFAKGDASEPFVFDFDTNETYRHPDVKRSMSHFAFEVMEPSLEVRDVLNRIGKCIRREFGDHVFASILYRRVVYEFAMRGKEFIVVDDLRFPVEFDYIRYVVKRLDDVVPTFIVDDNVPLFPSNRADRYIRRLAMRARREFPERVLTLEDARTEDFRELLS